MRARHRTGCARGRQTEQKPGQKAEDASMAAARRGLFRIAANQCATYFSNRATPLRASKRHLRTDHETILGKNRL